MFCAWAWCFRAGPELLTPIDFTDSQRLSALHSKVDVTDDYYSEMLEVIKKARKLAKTSNM